MCFRSGFLLLFCFCLVLFSSNGSGLKGGSEDLETWFPMVFTRGLFYRCEAFNVLLEVASQVCRMPFVVEPNRINTTGLEVS